MKNWRRGLLVGVGVMLISQLYLQLFVDGFRISAAVVLLPVLLMTIVKDENPVWICTCTGILVFCFRMILSIAGGVLWNQAVISVFPALIFYVGYGMVFKVMIRNRYTVGFSWLLMSIFTCDITANMVEVICRFVLQHQIVDDAALMKLVMTALIRTGVFGMIMYIAEKYRGLLTREEHERRYQHLFLMTTGLKNETYFMRKNSEEIEEVMSNAYRLYEMLSEAEMPDQMKHMALTIAKDVHEVKKDYLRIMQGVEKEIGALYDEESMSFRDILYILKSSTYQFLDSKSLHVVLDFEYEDNFVTKEHYSLMAVLKNLVNNAIEAIESGKKKGKISIHEKKVNDKYILTVSDDGPGISQKHLKHIFQMGYSTKFDYETGNIYRGVGLSGVKMVVEEELHGTIDVKTEEGKGTTFIIEIFTNILEDS